MKRQSIIAALLPRAYREQVFGDLHERGFHLRDVANVLPRVWTSCLIRSVTGPVPQLALATDAAIDARTQELARQGARAYQFMVFVWGFCLPYRKHSPDLALWQVLAVCLAIGLITVPGYFVALRRALPLETAFNRSRAQLVSRYR